MRRDTSLDPAGYPDFAIFPAGEREDYYPIEFYEPLSPGTKLLGLDHGAYPPGQEALERARDTGQPAASGRLESVLDQGQKPRFMIVLPAYRDGLPLTTVEARRAALSGFVYARFRVEELLNNVMGQSLLQELYFEVFDGGPKGLNRSEPLRANLLYDVDAAEIPHAFNPDFKPRFTTTSHVEVAGRNWIFYFASKPAFLAGSRTTPWLILSGGLLLSFAVFMIVLMLSTERMRVAEEVKRQKSLINQVLDALPINVFLKDEDGCFVMVNEQCARTCGFPKDALIGKCAFDVFPHEVARSLLAYDEEARAANGPLMREVRLISEGGEMFVLAGKTMITPVGGETSLLLGFSLDISERKKAEQALRESEERFRGILDNSTAVIYIKDLEGRYVLINRRYEKLFHVSNAEMVGKTDYDYFPRELADTYRENDQQVLEGGKAVEFEEISQQDGALHTYISVKFPLYRVSGEPYALCGISTDITEHLRLERQAAAARANQLSHALTSAVGEGMIGLDLFQHATFVNPKAEELLGVKEAEMLGRKLVEITHCQTADGRPVTDEACPLSQVIVDGKTFQTDDWQFLRRNGEPLPVSMVIAPIFEEGGINGAVMSFQDITRRKRAEEELKHHIAELARINAELDEFSYVASHDLQEPLRKLIAFSDWLRRDLGEGLPERANKDIEFITDAANRMQTLVQELLMLSRTGKTSMVREWVHLDEIIDRALDALSLRIEETGAVIGRDPLPEVWGDPTLLAQLYLNLIGNALKFVDNRAPHIHLTAERQNGEWILGVRDNGIGIRPEYAEQIFQPFKRLHGRGIYEGSGIGLAVCRKVVERHHGRIWVESEEGHGAHFKFALPGREDGQPAPQ